MFNSTMRTSSDSEPAIASIASSGCFRSSGDRDRQAKWGRFLGLSSSGLLIYAFVCGVAFVSGLVAVPALASIWWGLG